MSVIYKVCSQELWDAAVTIGKFVGAEIDIADGFIHFSTGAQVEETVAKHFAGRENLVLVWIDADQLGDAATALKWEESRGGALFPHLYAELPVSAASRVDELPLGEDGSHIFPNDLIR